MNHFLPKVTALPLSRTVPVGDRGQDIKTQTMRTPLDNTTSASSPVSKAELSTPRNLFEQNNLPPTCLPSRPLASPPLPLWVFSSCALLLRYVNPIMRSQLEATFADLARLSGDHSAHCRRRGRWCRLRRHQRGHQQRQDDVRQARLPAGHLAGVHRPVRRPDR